MGRAYQNRKESMAKTSDTKAKVYSKYGREIYVCAKAGGVDPDGNLALRGLIDRAKKDQVPTHVIEKAIDKIFTDNIDVVILDFRLNSSDFENKKSEQITSIKLLKALLRLSMSMQQNKMYLNC